MTKEVFFTCEYYGERFKSKAKCLKHEEREKIKNKVNKMFQNGKTLKGKRVQQTLQELRYLQR